MLETEVQTDRRIDEAVQRLRERVDPEGRLPKVHFNVYETYEHTSWEPYFTKLKVAIEPTDTSDKPYGFTSLVIHKGNEYEPENYTHFDGIDLDEAHRGQGIGLATYLWAIERAWREGVPFSTQTVSQSPDAVRIWQHLVSLGVAEEMAPFKKTHEVDGVQKYTGDYTVPVPGHAAVARKHEFMWN